MTHKKVSQFWVSESGAAVTGRSQHGYFAVCSCGAEIHSGPSTPYDVPKPDRLVELEEKEHPNEEEIREQNRLWIKWNSAWRKRLDDSLEQDAQNMLLAIEKHAAAVKETQQP